MFHRFRSCVLLENCFEKLLQFSIIVQNIEFFMSEKNKTRIRKTHNMRHLNYFPLSMAQSFDVGQRRALGD